MTTIAYSRKHNSISSDSQVTEDNLFSGSAVKVKDFGKFVVAVSGLFYVSQEVILNKYKTLKACIDYINGLDINPETGGASYMIIDKKTQDVYLGDSKTKVTLAEKAEHYAIGSGKDFALGAMYAGCLPEEAIEIASRLDVYTGGEIKTLYLGLT